MLQRLAGAGCSRVRPVSLAAKRPRAHWLSCRRAAAAWRAPRPGPRPAARAVRRSRAPPRAPSTACTANRATLVAVGQHQRRPARLPLERDGAHHRPRASSVAPMMLRTRTPSASASTRGRPSASTAPRRGPARARRSRPGRRRAEWTTPVEDDLSVSTTTAVHARTTSGGDGAELPHGPGVAGRCGDGRRGGGGLVEGCSHAPIVPGSCAGAAGRVRGRGDHRRRPSTRRGSAAALPPVEQLRADLWSIPVPMSPARCATCSVYAFALAGGGLGLIDTGWDSDEGWDGADHGLREIGAASPTSAASWSPTCTSTTSGWPTGCAQASGAWLAMHPADAAVVGCPTSATPAAAPTAEVDFLVSLGAGPDEAVADVGPRRELRAVPRMAVPDRLLEDGDLADFPGLAAARRPHPGPHARSPLLRRGAHRAVLLAATTCSPGSARTSPPPPAAPPTRCTTTSPRSPRSADRPPTEVLPAHEWRFRGLAAGPTSSRAHHEHRLDELLDALRAHPGSTPWQLAAHLTWSRPWEPTSGGCASSPSPRPTPTCACSPAGAWSSAAAARCRRGPSPPADRLRRAGGAGARRRAPTGRDPAGQRRRPGRIGEDDVRRAAGHGSRTRHDGAAHGRPLRGLDARRRRRPVDDGVLEPLAQGRPGSYRRYDWTPERFADAPDRVPLPEVLVVEGCGSSPTARRMDDAADLGGGTAAAPPGPGLARDGDHLADHWLRWQREEAAEFAAEDTRARADVRVDGGAAGDAGSVVLIGPPPGGSAAPGCSIPS